LRIRIFDPHIGQLHVTPSEWAEEAAIIFDMDTRVTGVPGEAFDLLGWYGKWRTHNQHTELNEPSHLRVVAADEFTALIPWEQLVQSAIQFAINGQPLSKGYPIRLYVPNGTSECLNVKSVVELEFLYDPNLDKEAAFGFKNEIKLEHMFIAKGNDDC
jgi:hypothetical protein